MFTTKENEREITDLRGIANGLSDNLWI